MECASCRADLDPIDRYCPACRLPNMQGSRHPRFGPAERDPGPAIAPRVAGDDERPCPRCRAGVRVPDHYCRSCGLDVSRLAPPPPHSRTAGVWTTPGPLGVDVYRPLGRLSVVIRLLVGAIALIGVGLAALAVAGWRALGAIPARSLGSVDAHTDWLSVEAWLRDLAVVQIALVGVVSVLTVVWSRRAYRNLRCLGVTGRRVAPMWATLGWLVPGLNLVVPKLVVDDTWRASAPDIESGSCRWRGAPVPTVNHMWWVCTVVALPTVTLAMVTFLTMDVRPTDLRAVHAAEGSLLVLAVGELLVVFAALLFTLTVAGIAERQRLRAIRIGPAARPTLQVPEVEELPVPIVLPVRGPVLLHAAGTAAGAGRY